MFNDFILLQCFGLSTQTCCNYLGPARNSRHKRPEREDSQAHSQHGAVEETHHLGAAKVNSQHYYRCKIILIQCIPFDIAL